MTCTAECWTPVPCPACGNSLPPRGRDVPMEANLPSCCEDNRYMRANQRHFWSEAEAVEWAAARTSPPTTAKEA